jgi:hypothetical protein
VTPNEAKVCVEGYKRDMNNNQVLGGGCACCGERDYNQELVNVPLSNLTMLRLNVEQFEKYKELEYDSNKSIYKMGRAMNIFRKLVEYDPLKSSLSSFSSLDDRGNSSYCNHSKDKIIEIYHLIGSLQAKKSTKKRMKNVQDL